MVMKGFFSILIGECDTCYQGLIILFLILLFCILILLLCNLMSFTRIIILYIYIII